MEVTRPPHPPEPEQPELLLDATSSNSMTGSQLPGTGPCIGCGNPDAPFRGELRTTPVTPGVVRDERVRRCTSCFAAHRSQEVAR
jgi:hypothetical protein